MWSLQIWIATFRLHTAGLLQTVMVKQFEKFISGYVLLPLFFLDGGAGLLSFFSFGESSCFRLVL